MYLPGSALEGGAVFECKGQAAIRVCRGVVQQAAPELFTEGGDLAVLLFQDAEFYPLQGTIESGLTTFVIVLIVIACTVVVVGIAIGVYIGVTNWKKRNNNMLQANLIQNNYGNLFGQNNIN